MCDEDMREGSINSPPAKKSGRGKEDPTPRMLRGLLDDVDDVENGRDFVNRTAYERGDSGDHYKLLDDRSDDDGDEDDEKI